MFIREYLLISLLKISETSTIILKIKIQLNFLFPLENSLFVPKSRQIIPILI
jgi:hypothetical protein